MEAARAPLDLKGTREPLMLLATGLFLCAFPSPITFGLGFAGIACGMHDLHATEAAAALGTQRRALEISAIACCAGCVFAFFAPALAFVIGLAQILTLAATVIALARIARGCGAARLAAALLWTSWIPAVALALGGFLSPALAVAIWVVSVLAHAILALRLRTLALPYGKRQPKIAR